MVDKLFTCNIKELLSCKYGTECDPLIFLQTVQKSQFIGEKMRVWKVVDKLFTCNIKELLSCKYGTECDPLIFLQTVQ